MKNRYRDLNTFTKEHSLCILSDVAGTEHIILCLHRAEIVSNEFFINYTLRWSGDRKIPSSGKPRSLVVGETFKHLSAIAAQIIYDAVIDGFLSGREHIRVKAFCFYNGIKSIIFIAEVYVPVDRAMYPCLTVLCKEKCLIEGIIKALNIIESFLQGEWSDIFALVQQVLDDKADFSCPLFDSSSSE